MKIGILAPESNEWHVERLSEEPRKREIEHAVFSPTSFLSGISPDGISVESSGRNVLGFDALIVRRIPGGTLERVIFRMDVLHAIESCGVRLINGPSSIEKAVDKYYTMILLKRAGLPVPRTITAERFEDAMEAFRRLGGDVVIKPIFGSFGTGILRIDDEDLAYRVFKGIGLIGGVYYLQEYIPHGNQDIRVFIVGGRVIAAMRRISSEWRTNIARGARPMPYHPDPEVKEISVRAADVLGLEYTGVDIIEDKDRGPMIVELNSAPAWRGLQQVTKVNIAKEIVDYVIDVVKR